MAKVLFGDLLLGPFILFLSQHLVSCLQDRGTAAIADLTPVGKITMIWQCAAGAIFYLFTDLLFPFIDIIDFC